MMVQRKFGLVRGLPYMAKLLSGKNFAVFMIFYSRIFV